MRTCFFLCLDLAFWELSCMISSFTWKVLVLSQYQFHLSLKAMVLRGLCPPFSAHEVLQCPSTKLSPRVCSGAALSLSHCLWKREEIASKHRKKHWQRGKWKGRRWEKQSCRCSGKGDFSSNTPTKRTYWGELKKKGMGGKVFYEEMALGKTSGERGELGLWEWIGEF